MAFDLARSSILTALLALGAAAGCGGAGTHNGGDEEDPIGASTDPITTVDQTGVKRQSIGNCWIYATASWAESLAKTATGAENNFSESYWTYWHWFEQIANGNVSDKISTGGTYGTAAEIINRYGLMSEAAFIPEEASAEMSDRQAAAEQAINASLASGPLSSASARADRGVVRSELDKAFALGTNAIAQLNRVFGKRVSRTLDRGAPTTGTDIKRAKDIAIKQHNGRTNLDVEATLADAIGTRSGWSGRSGPMAWNELSYPDDLAGRRHFQERFQRALADHLPVILSWYVDFNAMDGATFRAPPATPGRQGGHMVVMDDYQINNVPGFGTLLAGVDETRPEALAAALDDSATIEFIRIKNSWGTYRHGWTTGYHDLYMAYMNGPIQECQVDENDNPIQGTCFDTTPLESVALPPGY